MDRELSTTKLKTPAGMIWLVAIGEAIWGAQFEPGWVSLAIRLARKGWEVEPGSSRKKDTPILVRATQAIAEYFAGELSAPRKIRLSLEGSETRLAVWNRVRKIRPGETLTYAELAEAVGMPGAFRATGAANAANPCVLFVPDHRVVTSSGGLAGYGAGVEMKAWLLRHEGLSY